jgi:tubulin polyglutamylase TTLL4
MFKNGATLLSFIMSGWEVQYTRRPTYKEKPGTSPPWLLYWGGRWRPDPAFEQGMRGAHPAVDATAGKCYGARVNHFPATYLLGRKDNLALQVQKLARRCQGDAALARTVRTLIPPTYIIPRDLDRLRRLVEELAPSAERLIAKPAALSRGRGVTLFAASDGLPEFLLNPTARAAAAAAQDDEEGSEGGEDVPYVVQRYLADPLLVNGFKVDLRLYVVCTSFDPLKVFLYNDGLARFATEPYSVDATSTYAHITNYSINQQNENFVAPEGDGTG